MVAGAILGLAGQVLPRPFRAETIAHELGTQYEPPVTRRAAPLPMTSIRRIRNTNGTIGAWGYDFRDGRHAGIAPHYVLI